MMHLLAVYHELSTHEYFVSSSVLFWHKKISVRISCNQKSTRTPAHTNNYGNAVYQNHKYPLRNKKLQRRDCITNRHAQSTEAYIFIKTEHPSKHTSMMQTIYKGRKEVVPPTRIELVSQP